MIKSKENLLESVMWLSIGLLLITRLLALFLITIGRRCLLDTGREHFCCGLLLIMDLILCLTAVVGFVEYHGMYLAEKEKYRYNIRMKTLLDGLLLIASVIFTWTDPFLLVLFGYR